jgi:hypothetical protein
VLAVAVAVHLGLAIALAAGGLRPFYNDIRNRPGPAADFFAVYHAGRQVWTGASPYEREELPAVTPPHFAPFRYPPGVAWTLGVAVAKIKPWIAYGAWIVLLEALLVLGLVRMRELIADPVHLAWARAGWLAFPPWFLELWMGQFTFVAAILTFLAVLDWRRDRPRRAAAMWAAACALKLFPLALAPALAFRRRWGALATGAAVTAAALAPLLAIEGAVGGFFGLNFGAPEPMEVHAGNFSLLVLLHRVVEAVAGAPPDPGAWIWVAGARLGPRRAGHLGDVAVAPRRPRARRRGRAVAPSAGLEGLVGAPRRRRAAGDRADDRRVRRPAPLARRDRARVGVRRAAVTPGRAPGRARGVVPGRGVAPHRARPLPRAPSPRGALRARPLRRR